MTKNTIKIRFLLRLLRITSLLFFAWNSPSFADDKNLIEITSAIWSKKEITSLAKQFCDGKEKCNYKVSPKFIGAASDPTDLSFSIVWKCSLEQTSYQKNIPSNAVNQILPITCDQNLKNKNVLTTSNKSPIFQPDSTKNTTSKTQQTMCNVEKYLYNPLPFDWKGHYHPECEPRVLYSWIMTNWVYNDTASGTFNSSVDDQIGVMPAYGKRFLFRTPIGTFQYGNFSLRLKLKPNVQFKIISDRTQFRDCNVPEAEKRNTVFIWAQKDYQYRPQMWTEYMVCSNDVIESISAGLSEHQSEIQSEVDYVKSLLQSGKSHNDHDAFENPQGGPHYSTNCFLGYRLIDGRLSCEEEVLMNSLNTMNTLSNSNFGFLFEPGNPTNLINDVEKRKNHFTHKPGYWFKTQ